MLDCEAIFHFLIRHAIEIIGLVLGLCYLYYEYQASVKLWLFSLLMPMISMVVYFNAGLYADFSINIYYLLASVYGLIAWRGTKRRKPRCISRAGWRVLSLCALATAAIWAAIYFLLDRYTNSTVPVADAFTTAMSIVATWMLARKYIEQWVAWLIVDAVCVGLFIYKDIPFYAVLYLAYTVVAVLGFQKWRRLMASADHDA